MHILSHSNAIFIPTYMLLIKFKLKLWMFNFPLRSRLSLLNTFAIVHHKTTHCIANIRQILRRNLRINIWHIILRMNESGRFIDYFNNFYYIRFGILVWKTTFPTKSSPKSSRMKLIKSIWFTLALLAKRESDQIVYIFKFVSLKSYVIDWNMFTFE